MDPSHPFDEFSQPPTLPKRPVRILYMEDDAGLARLFQKHLERAGYKVDLASDGSSGLALFREGEYDVLAVDYKMPVQDGLQVIESLGAEERRVPPTIMLTANGDEALAVEALKLGASDYIVKDTAGGYIRLLPTVIERLLEKHRLQEAQAEAQEALRQSEERLRQITASASDAIISFDRHGKVLLFNRSARLILGLTEEDALGKPLESLVHGPFLELYRRSLEQGQSDLRQVVELEILLNDGRSVPVEASFSMAKSGREPLYTCILRDITDRLRAQSALQEAARLNATATLAGGIAHQFNNLLFGVLGSTELLQMRLEDRPDAIGRLDMIRHQAERATNLVQQLLAFARRGRYQPVILDVNDTVGKSLTARESELGPEVVVERELSRNLWKVSADPTQLSQVVTNLFENALEAVEGQGHIQISTANYVHGPGSAENKASNREEAPEELQAGRYVMLRVDDDGCGMDPATLDQIFTPFFTTKFKGRGLGMAAVWGIVQHHGGRIEIESDVGKGTAIRVFLPALDPQTGGRAPTRSVLAAPRGNETILVADEENVTLSISRELLELLGYRVLTAHGGHEAVAASHAYGGEIHLILMDMNLSDPSSREVFPRLVEARPEVKVILWSGRDEDSSTELLMKAGASSFLHKPFGLEVLALEVRRVLDG